MAIVWTLIIGGLIGWISSLIIGIDIPGGIIGNIIVGFIGAWLGVLLLGEWGPLFKGVYILPTLIGSLILVSVVSYIGVIRNNYH
ncbi:GlsB/YeaQ/YmgE family stress response membrane protein [Virgibacillus siamensis]|uniref:GlsB/YeaQ/YmgE family stress response membrane protein n=1 Tax=Virgibacillus siamensis TaxID=480071 RepID=UPI00098625FE|nr:GlsB/YeaQ/YmgE family stress response membrane protein [Virgibacillus siamensis]